jgi:hypothetical protein
MENDSVDHVSESTLLDESSKVASSFTPTKSDSWRDHV